MNKYDSWLERILNYLVNNLLSAIYGIGILFSILIIFFYCNGLSFHPGPQFNIQSSLYLFVVLPMIVGMFFIFFAILCFSPGFVGHEIFKDLLKIFRQSENKLEDKKARIKLWEYFYAPLFLLLLLFIFVPHFFKPNGILMLLLVIIFPALILVRNYFSLKKIKNKNIKMTNLCIAFYVAWFIFLMILDLISTFLSITTLHLSLLEKYSSIILIMALIFTFNMIISCSFRKFTIVRRCILAAFFCLITLMIIDINFRDHARFLQAIAKLSGIRKDGTEIIVTPEGCAILKIRAPGIIKTEQYGMCETSSINVLFNLGNNCLIDPLQKNVFPFSIPCDDIKSYGSENQAKKEEKLQR